MRVLTAISFSLILLFNFYGYRLVFSYMQTSNEAILEKQVDQNQYNEAELITIKTKLNLPYYSSSAQYERAYGSITIQGISYQYVKRRVLNDTLELLCLPNYEKTKIQTVSNELAKSLADGQASTPKKNTTIKITLPDFFQPVKNYNTALVSSTQKQYSLADISYLSAGHRLRQERPPQVL